MQNNSFKVPLIQSAILLGVVILLLAIVASSGGENSPGFFSSVGNLILFCIGMSVSLIVSIAILFGVFLAAVAMVAPDQAASMAAHIKRSFICQNQCS